MSTITPAPILPAFRRDLNDVAVAIDEGAPGFVLIGFQIVRVLRRDTGSIHAPHLFFGDVAGLCNNGLIEWRRWRLRLSWGRRGTCSGGPFTLVIFGIARCAVVGFIVGRLG